MSRHTCPACLDTTRNGRGGIRTPETRITRLTVFKTAAFNRSATLPRDLRCYAPGLPTSPQRRAQTGRAPTLMIFGQTNVVSRLFGPCDLICGDQRIPQERVVDFLTEQLANRGGRRPSL